MSADLVTELWAEVAPEHALVRVVLGRDEPRHVLAGEAAGHDGVVVVLHAAPSQHDVVEARHVARRVHVATRLHTRNIAVKTFN